MQKVINELKVRLNTVYVSEVTVGEDSSQLLE